MEGLIFTPKWDFDALCDVICQVVLLVFMKDAKKREWKDKNLTDFLAPLGDFKLQNFLSRIDPFKIRSRKSCQNSHGAWFFEL